MKKFILFMLTMFTFVGCANHDFGTSYEAYQKNNFDKKFKNEFGKPASNQDWGFDGIAIFNFKNPLN